MATYKLMKFSKFARGQNLTRNKLLDVINAAGDGLCIPLGGGVYKERVIGKGNRANVRVIFAFRIGAHSFFIDGYLKKNKDNLSVKQLKTIKTMAKYYLNLTNAQINNLVNVNKITRV